jgi:hypothetical protein
VEGGLRKWSISLYGSSVRGTCRRKRKLWRWASLSMGVLLGNLKEGSYARASVWKKVLGQVSLPIEVLLGNLGSEGSIYQ